MHASPTNEQIKMMKQLEVGFCWEWHIRPKEDEVLRYLMDQGVCEAREDILSGWLQLSQKGCVLLDGYRNQCAQAEKEEANRNAQEALHMKERNEDVAAEERRHQEQKSTQIKAALLSAVLSFVAGVLTEHHLQIAEFFGELFSQG